MSVEDVRNRDLFFKFVLMHYIMHILKILGIDEEAKEIMTSEMIGIDLNNFPKVFDDFFDFRIKTESGKIILFEFKKRNITRDDIKQLYEYTMHIICEDKSEVIPILLTISEGGFIDDYKTPHFTFHPIIIKSKSISKQKDLNIIRNKLKDNEMLTSLECSLLTVLPIFKTEESEAEIVDEVCNYIKNKKDCIPKEDYAKMVLPMYLNIIEYIDEDKQEEMKRRINMSKEVYGVIAQLKSEGRNEGVAIGEKNIIKRLLVNYSIAEISKMIHLSVNEIKNILNK